MMADDDFFLVDEFCLVFDDEECVKGTAASDTIDDVNEDEDDELEFCCSCCCCCKSLVELTVLVASFYFDLLNKLKFSVVTLFL
jgi:hypothetical protein